MTDSEKGKGADKIDKEAYFNYLLDTYERLVYSICFKMTGNQFDAEDLTQETFLSVYKNLATFQRDYEKAWICKIATNKIADKSFGAKTGQYTGARFMFGNGRNYRKALWHTNRAMCRRTNC